MNQKQFGNDTLEIERLKIERLKIYVRLIAVILSVIFGTLGVTLINSSIQKRQIESQKLQNEAQLKLQKEKADADRRQAEMKYLGDYLSYAIEDDIDKRMRFAGYFATLTISSDLQEKWKDYYKSLEASVNEKIELEKELELAEKSKDTAQIADIERKVAIINKRIAALSPFPDKNIVLIVPYGVGSKTDLITRILAQAIRINLSHDVLVLNIPGKVGWQRAAAAKPDGYTLTVYTNRLPTESQGTISLADFEPIAIVAKGIGILAPKGTNSRIIEKLENAIRQAVYTTSYIETLNKYGIQHYFAGSNDFYAEIKDWLSK